MPFERPETRLACALRTPAEVEAGAPVPLTFALRNVSKESISFLIWLTPFEGWRGNILRVTRNGEKVQYHGIMASRVVPPPPGAWFTVVKEVELSVTLDVGRAYPMNVPGRYVIDFSGRLLDTYAASEKRDHRWNIGATLPCTGATVDVKPPPPSRERK